MLIKIPALILLVIVLFVVISFIITALGALIVKNRSHESSGVSDEEAS